MEEKKEDRKKPMEGSKESCFLCDSVTHIILLIPHNNPRLLPSF